MKPFKQGALHPVIMVIDNDVVSTKIFKHLTNILGKPIGGIDPFYHVYGNLYVVPIPKVAAHVAIEDLFDPVLLNRQIDGRVLNKSNKKFDTTRFYGKNEFATRIVAPERTTIDFSRFEPLLKNLSDVIEDYAGRLATERAAAAAAPKIAISVL
jgi:hypothetical protein